MINPRLPLVVAASFLLLAGWARPSSAQQPPPPTPSAGPLVLEPMHNGFILAPEVKVTRFDKKTGTLAGGYGGWVKDDRLFIGGGGYGLVDRKSGDRNLAYGGLLIGWFFNPNQPVSVGAKTLVGFGQISQRFAAIPYCLLPEQYLCSARPVRDTDPFDRRVRLHNNFFVAEPEVDVLAKLGGLVRLSGGVGYRLTDERRAFESEAHGVTGTFSVQFNF